MSSTPTVMLAARNPIQASLSCRDGKRLKAPLGRIRLIRSPHQRGQGAWAGSGACSSFDHLIGLRLKGQRNC